MTIQDPNRPFYILMARYYVERYDYLNGLRNRLEPFPKVLSQELYAALSMYAGMINN